MPVTKLKQLRVKKLVQHRVANQTRMGKIAKQYILMIAGDRKGLLGIGEGSAVESEQALMKARRNAIRGMVPIPRYENRTIFGDIKGKVGATELELYTRPPGKS
jgi:small subunit ribosomal protein S5